jgi:hypothetical protein
MTARCHQVSLPLVSTQPPPRDLRLLQFRDRCYAGNWLLDHVDDDGFDLGAQRLIRCCFFRGAAFTVRLGLAAVLRFVPRLGADFEALRILLPAAESLRNLARFFGRALARFFRLAMIDPPSRSLRRSLEECMRWRFMMRARKSQHRIESEWQSFV